MATALGRRLTSLLADRRDGLRSEERKPAARGMRWSANPAADEMLAGELQATLLRRTGEHLRQPAHVLCHDHNGANHLDLTIEGSDGPVPIH